MTPKRLITLLALLALSMFMVLPGALSQCPCAARRAAAAAAAAAAPVDEPVDVLAATAAAAQAGEPTDAAEKIAALEKELAELKAAKGACPFANGECPFAKGECPFAKGGAAAPSAGCPFAKGGECPFAKRGGAAAPAGCPYAAAAKAKHGMMDAGCPFAERYNAGGEYGLPAPAANVRQKAPGFNVSAVVNGEISEVSLASYRGKYVVLLFYPLDFTFVCPTEILAFNDRLAEFHAINAEVLAISCDSVYTHLAWTQTPRNKGGLGAVQMPLLSDLNRAVSLKYDVLLRREGHPLRGLFIIDDKGILRQKTVNDLPVGRSVDETLRLVQAFQHTDVHGEVCPAGWTPGKDTIVPNPSDKLSYFSKNNE